MEGTAGWQQQHGTYGLGSACASQGTVAQRQQVCASVDQQAGLSERKMDWVHTHSQRRQMFSPDIFTN